MAIDSQILVIAPFILALLIISYAVYFMQDVKFMMTLQVEYETAFWKHNRNLINKQHQGQENKPLPLTFPHKDATALLTLCKQYISAWSPTHYKNRWDLKKYEPSIQVLNMHFRRIAVARRPLRVEAIRCGDKKALIEAGDGFSGFVLIEDETNDDSNITMFKIFTKFQYERRVPRALGADNQRAKID